jgi:HAD superfamily hydrolase (TIGR01509 family)
MPIKTCFFDMGNVLVHFSHQKMCRNIATLCGWSEPETTRFLMDEGRQWKLERGEITEEQFHDEFCRATGKSLNIDELRHAAADIFWLNESIVPVLHRLKEAGRRLVLLSNTSITHLNFIERNFNVLELMDDRVTSFEAGAIKPENRIYEVALSKAQCDPDECFYTDDIEAYIRKAETFGIHSRIYTTTERLLDSLGELEVLSC